MRHALALLLSAAALVSPIGCVAVGGGGGWADNWSVPAPMAKPDRYTGVDFSSITFVPTFGLCHYSDSDERLTAAYVTYDLGILATRGPFDNAWWPIFKPLIGWYDWPESPQMAGCYTGLKIGTGVFLGGRGSSMWLLTFEYGWLTLHDTVGDNDARLQTATLALVLTGFADMGF